MKLIHNLILSVLILLLYQACIIEERYHFHEDLTGEYSMFFDYSLMSEEDSSKEMKISMDAMMDSLYEQVNYVDGISNAQKKSEGYSFTLSYEFDGLKTLNRMESIDDPEGENEELFKLKGKRLLFRPNFDELMESMEQGSVEGEVETMNDDEMMANLSKLFKVKTVISFDQNVKVKRMKKFQKTSVNTFEFDSEKEGFDSQPELEVKL
ncbi:MAG: hypothetical protein HKO93_06845 [Flavobacteriales bacterium]|nr:hypothetical protein [Flavobacteriales bacterium]